MKKTAQLLFVALMAVLVLASCGGKYSYETAPNDPMKTRVYTLDNGLKVYMSVNKDEPRVQTYVAVRVGGKNDPAETTGLAHYFEHLMFKGTSQFGTQDFAAEKVMLDEIEALFEQYRNTTDDAERKAIYRQIDSVSQEASKLAIPNEYDKLMSAIGSRGTNAFTSNDVTAYVENIPANQIEAWAKIQSIRFADPVIRLFHTELETVYEEKNMSLTQDSRKSSEAMLAALFPHHPYGTQTVLGTQEHLKNPSIINIKKYWETYYVANNMAVIMSGDFDPDKTIEVIDKYFGTLRQGDVPAVKTDIETPITAPVIREVWGNDAENVMLAFRFPGSNTADAETLQLVDYLMNNGAAGLVDLNLNQKQLLLGAGGGVYDMSDYSAYILSGRPKQGQTIEQVKDLLLGQIELLKKGEFDDGLIEATINNFKLREIQQTQYNGSRAYMYLDMFVNQVPLKKAVGRLDRQSKITKQNIVDFANKYFGDNYVVVYKRQGEDKNVQKIDKPQITPIATNRDEESDFLKEIKEIQVQPIEPVFVDYDKDLQKMTTATNLPVLYKQNTENGLFELTYLFDMGNDNDKTLGIAFDYIDYLGTSEYTPEQIKQEFYKIACSVSLHAASDRVYITINGLDENFDKAITLAEALWNDSQVNQEAFDNLILDINKARADAKLNQRMLFSMLTAYGQWGAKSSQTNVLNKNELANLQPQELIDRVKDLKNYEHRVLYYGPKKAEQLTDIISNVHTVAAELKTVPAPVVFTQQETPSNKVYFVQYNANQLYMTMLSKGVTYDKSLESIRSLYNDYFGGGMNGIVFQEMREARGLAYTARANYSGVSKPHLSYFMNTMIATQNDKLTDAANAFLEIINNMPVSEKAFNLSKDNLISNLRAERIIRSSVLWSYINAQRMGYTYDARKDKFEQFPNMTLEDVKAFQEQYIKDRRYVYCILGDKDGIGMAAMKKYGPVQELSLEEIFGY